MLPWITLWTLFHHIKQGQKYYPRHDTLLRDISKHGDRIISLEYTILSLRSNTLSPRVEATLIFQNMRLTMDIESHFPVRLSLQLQLKRQTEI